LADGIGPRHRNACHGPYWHYGSSPLARSRRRGRCSGRRPSRPRRVGRYSPGAPCNTRTCASTPDSTHRASGLCACVLLSRIATCTSRAPAAPTRDPLDDRQVQLRQHPRPPSLLLCRTAALGPLLPALENSSVQCPSAPVSASSSVAVHLYDHWLPVPRCPFHQFLCLTAHRPRHNHMVLGRGRGAGRPASPAPIEDGGGAAIPRLVHTPVPTRRGRRAPRSPTSTSEAKATRVSGAPTLSRSSRVQRHPPAFPLDDVVREPARQGERGHRGRR
jgi:hypothetical protein